MSISGDARSFILTTPPVDSPGCGLVDILDFPLDPPEAEDIARGGQDFGVYRGRYQAYHAGEDWWLVRGRSNFGAPVYSIGHGRVTYAAPLGWGRDQGVIIIRHTFADGREILSFYGHLDPPSIVLNVGDCVVRGDKIGEIGDPTTAPHLHFEIRTHLPYEPASGYWSEDPTLAGWLPPSQTIWESRIGASPGVLWTRPAEPDGTMGLAILEDETYAVIEEGRINGISLSDGSRKWRIPGEVSASEWIADVSGSLIYFTASLGQVNAYHIPQNQTGEGSLPAGELADLAWSIDLEGFGFPTLMPLPGGGVVLGRNDALIVISQEGNILWEAEQIGKPFDWLVLGDQLLFTTIGGGRSVWTLDDSGLSAWDLELGGYLAGQENNIWLYDAEGIYRLDLASQTAELVYRLPQGLLAWGDIMATADGGALVAHRDRSDRRLILLTPDGQVRWQRSYERQLQGDLTLLTLDDALLVVDRNEANSLGKIVVYALDVEEVSLTHLFTGGTRSSIPAYTQVLPAGEHQLLVNIGGGSMAMIDIQQAIEAALPSARAH